MLISQISYLVNPQWALGGFEPDAALLGALTGIQTLLEGFKAVCLCVRACVCDRDREQGRETHRIKMN